MLPTVIELASVPNSYSIGSISDEWNACDTASRCTRHPCSRRTSATDDDRVLWAGDHHRLGAVDGGEV